MCYQPSPDGSFDKFASDLASCMTSKGYTLRPMTLGEYFWSTVTLPLIPPLALLGFLGGGNGFSMDCYDEYNRCFNAEEKVAPKLNIQYSPTVKVVSQPSATLWAAPRAVQAKPLSLEEFKTQCKVLGFKEGSQDFGNCVLELNESK